MATTSPTEGRFAQVLQCPICLETLRRPKVLPCGHTYCASCLQSHINSTMINRGTPQACFPCPVCRAETTLHDTTASVEQWAEFFPVNTIVSSVLDLAVETFGEKFCDICLKWNRETSAKSFCKDCKRFMCKICIEHHNEALANISHDVIDLSTENDPGIRIPSLYPIEKCLRHFNRTIELFCVDHNSFCCNTCGFFEHRKCERIIPIDDMLKTFDTKATSKDLEANIRIIGDHMKKITINVKENSNSIQNDKSAILQQIRSLRSELNAKLQKLEDDLIASLEINHKTEDLTLQNKEARGQSLISAIDSDLTQLNLVMTHGSEVQKVIILHNMEKNKNRYLKAISEYQEDLKYIKIGFEVNKNLNGLIHDLNSFGQITVTQSKTTLPLLPAVTPSQPNAETVSGSSGIQLNDRKAVKVSEISVNESVDNSFCYISDILTLQRAKQIFIDFNNRKIKVYGKNCQFQESMTLMGQPWSACILPDDNMAVTLPYKKTILVISIYDKMHKVREIKTRLRCWGVAVMKNQLVITTLNDEHSVLILDMNGSEIRTFRRDNYESEKLLNPYYVKINKTETIIYISYNNGNKMVAYNTSWDVVFTYTDQDMNSPRGIDTDREGNIYLCGYSSFNVQQISADGKLIKALITKKEDKKRPLAIKFYRNIDRFIPWSACILPDDNMAVTLPFNKTILVVRMEDKMHKVREIKTRLKCCGIAVMKDQLVITTGNDEHSVLILDMNGSEIRTVRRDNYESEKLLNPYYVKINKTETIIYISYNDGNKMVAYNTSWDIVFTYTDQDMNSPRGIDTDREGNIYLCGYSSFNVQQISADGKMIKALITKKEDKKRPLAIKFYRNIDRFIVTYHNSDVVEVYDMCD
ncbi:hypothetical protein CHS0354_022102 [Potamilus streckersoni]|uniref:Uncharacterized protein n=1 Tax=Potamilus streckersoni TaxID=2493646 RepID=A0AAE0VIR0_9BIVA|nr:hypothetical protein CHS0354_022102 [Potamilus streckersoni]